MKYLNVRRLTELDPISFRSSKPFPWINPEGVLTDDGYHRLVGALPDVSLFKKSFGYRRKHGQKSHDRYALEYSEKVDIPPPWKEFIAELKGDEYRAFLGRMLATDAFDLSCHWHYAPAGCSVSPHTDATRKHGSHVFYFNTAEDWDPAWGGQTVVLDDGGRLHYSSSPDFKDLELVAASQAVGNYSLLFQRGPHSWHGVQKLHCSPGHMRKVFIVVVNRVTPVVRLRRALGLLPRGW